MSHATNNLTTTAIYLNRAKQAFIPAVLTFVSEFQCASNNRASVEAFMGENE